MFIESSSPRRQGDNAMLISPAISNGPKCFHFWYHMYGPHIDTLNIYTLSNSNMSATLWRKKGTQGNKWFLSNVTVGGSGSFQASAVFCVKDHCSNVFSYENIHFYCRSLPVIPFLVS